MRGKLLTAALAAAAVLSTVGSAGAQPGHACFFVNQWNGWKAVDDHTVYLNISGGKIIRLDMASACRELTFSDARLITKFHDSSICSPLDWDLKVSEGPSFGVPCIVKGMTLLTPEQTAAVPKNLRP